MDKDDDDDEYTGDYLCIVCDGEFTSSPFEPELWYCPKCGLIMGSWQEPPYDEKFLNLKTLKPINQEPTND